MVLVSIQRVITDDLLRLGTERSVGSKDDSNMALVPQKFSI